MNEAIEKLARDVGLYDVFSDGDRWQSKDGGPSVSRLDLEAFAQAVAKRCAEICEATTEHGAMDMGGETKAYESAAAILAEFGLPASGQGGG